MKVLSHHIYEYKKGLRNLVLHTMQVEDIEQAIDKLTRHNISYCIQRVTTGKINIFFGKEECVNIIKLFSNKPLSEFSNEEDFILGIMLGYDRMQQCERYIKRNSKIFDAAQSKKTAMFSQTQI